MLNSRKYVGTQFFLNAFLIILCILVIFPLVLVLSVSFSNEADIAKYGYSIIPHTFDFSAYKYIFRNPTAVLNAYKVTAIFSLVSMVLSVFLMAMIAYPLTKVNLKGRSTLAFYLYFTMLFNGGLVPSYILITQYLHLGDTIWVYILPSLISPWYVFMMRSFFSGIPNDIVESAYIDGASEYRVFFTMILPISKPVLSAVALFMFLGKWNDWYTSMLYINKDELISLQYMLQRIMMNLQLLQNAEGSAASLIEETQNIPAETTRMAMAIIVAGPALIVFPFFQKYFVKGLTVGSVKG